MGVWCRVTVTSAVGEHQLRWVLAGRDDPDLSVVEGLACQQVAARRRGEHVLVDRICPALDALLELSGLRSEVVGQPEKGEQLGAEEAVEPGDPTV
jgi:hypothetical protein